ncbi:MAG: hypothetical protein J2P50_00750 [Hyphomicrobiaceae bacterium]|nr:hypothetical protein [Hyphomicrobiaceae bacterium]
MSGRRLIYLLIYPIPWIVIGAFSLAMPVIVGPAKDTFGLFFALVFGAVCLGCGAFQLWRFNVADPEIPLYPTVDDLPIEKRAAVLSRIMIFFSTVIILGTAVTTYQLVLMQYGWKEGAKVWAPVAHLYDLLGFWPAVMFIPGMGLLVIIEMARKLRAVRKATEYLDWPE